MRVIDLLNKIANGEKPIIKEGINTYKYNDIENDYITGMGYDYEHYFSSIDNILNYLNDEIEIIEEDKKIERLQWCNIKGDSTKAQLLELRENVILQFDKINEIIDYINKGE